MQGPAQSDSQPIAPPPAEQSSPQATSAAGQEISLRCDTSAAACARMSWAATRELIRSDFRRLLEIAGSGTLPKRIYWFLLPNYQVMFLYRLYRHLFVNGFHNTARLLHLFSLYLTGADIPPTTSIGPGCLIGHNFGVILYGKIGARFSIFGQGGTGGGIGKEDIGGGPGLPVIGDHVVFGVKAMALGPIKIGDRVNLAPGAFAASDVPDDALVLCLPSKILTVRMPRA